MSLSWVEATRLAAKGGPADRLRRWLIVGCAALGTMIVAAAATIPSQWADVGPSSVLGQLLADSGVAVGLMIALVVMSLPVVHLAVQAVQVGAPVRDRRLRALRTAGATLADVRRVVRAEVVVTCAAGAVLGLIAYYAFMWAAPQLLRVSYADHFEQDGADIVTAGTVPVIGLNVWPNPVVIVGAAAVVPLVAAVLVPLVVRRTPLQATQATRDQRKMSPGLARAYVGSATVAAISVLVMIFAPVDGNTWQGELVNLMFIPLLLGTFALLLCTLVVFASGTASFVGKVLVRHAGPAGLLAGKMMRARPGLASRTAVSLVLVGFVGGLAIPLQGVLETDYLGARWQGGGPTIGPDGVASSDVLYYTMPIVAVQALALFAAVLGAIGLLVAVAEQVSLRGNDLARQVAVGVPRRLIRRALVIEAATPTAVMASVALLVGAAIPVLSVSLTGNAELLERVGWARLVGFWSVLVVVAVFAAWLGGLSLRSAADPQRIRDRE